MFAAPPGIIDTIFYCVNTQVKDENPAFCRNAKRLRGICAKTLHIRPRGGEVKPLWGIKFV